MAIAVASQKICALGPIKCEVVQLTGASGADTFTTLIQNPQAAGGWTTGASDTSSLTCSISGKTVTLNSATLSNATALVLVFGF